MNENIIIPHHTIVVVAALSVPPGNCSDGDIRLVGGGDSELEGTREGRVEICINNAWGSVCDELFREEDAQVVCDQLEGFQRNGEGVLMI